jgi:hypothetical protein
MTEHIFTVTGLIGCEGAQVLHSVVLGTSIRVAQGHSKKQRPVQHLHLLRIPKYHLWRDRRVGNTALDSEEDSVVNFRFW